MDKVTAQRCAGWRKQGRKTFDRRERDLPQYSTIIPVPVALNKFEETAKAITLLAPKRRPAAKSAALLAAIEDKTLSRADLEVFVILLEMMNWKSGRCFPGYALLAERTRRSRATVIRAVQALEKYPHILTDVRLPQNGSRMHQSNRYTFPTLVSDLRLVATQSKPSAKLETRGGIGDETQTFEVPTNEITLPLHPPISGGRLQ